MAEQLDAQTPEDRVEAAARDLDDRGQAVTARAVREAAGVRMAVAAAAARAWREATAEASEVEDEQATTAGQRDAAQQAQQTAEDQLREVTQTISSRDASITELREQNRVLTGQLEALIARIPAPQSEDQNSDQQE